MADISKTIASGQALGVAYHVCARSGVVEGTETRSETEVSGSISGGGGMTVQGTGASAPVSGRVESKTTRYQTIFLKEDDGDEHTIELVDFLVPCKEGQRLTMFVLKLGKNMFGPHVHAFNHNARQHYEDIAGIRSAMFPWKVFMGSVGAVAALVLLSGFTSSDASLGETLFVTVILTAIAAFVVGVAGRVVGMIRARAVRKNPEFLRFQKTLESEARAAKAA